SKMGDIDIDTLTVDQYLALTRGNQASGMNDDAHEHVERVLDIVSLFNIQGVSHDTIMLHIFPITLTGAAKRWIDRIPSGSINTWDLLEKAFIQRTSSGSLDEIAPITIKLDSLERDIKKLKENVHAIQVGYGLCRGTHPYKECPLNKKVKGIEDVKYGKFGRSFPNNGRNGARYRVGLPRNYTRMENHPPFGEKKPSLKDLNNKHIEESTRRRNETEDLMKKLQENTYMNIKNQNAALKNLETHIEQLKKDFQAKASKEAPNSSPPIGHCKVIFADNDVQSVEICSNDTNKLHGV
ncbi:hypothetical protein Tco_0721783, partial [Tanacetum coccineum]